MRALSLPLYYFKTKEISKWKNLENYFHFLLYLLYSLNLLLMFLHVQELLWVKDWQLTEAIFSDVMRISQLLLITIKILLFMKEEKISLVQYLKMKATDSHILFLKLDINTLLFLMLLLKKEYLMKQDSMNLV